VPMACSRLLSVKSYIHFPSKSTLRLELPVRGSVFGPDRPDGRLPDVYEDESQPRIGRPSSISRALCAPCRAARRNAAALAAMPDRPAEG
jgi:hypothetical protein